MATELDLCGMLARYPRLVPFLLTDSAANEDELCVHGVSMEPWVECAECDADTGEA